MWTNLTILEKFILKNILPVVTTIILTQKKQKGISGILIYVNGNYVTNSDYKGYYKLKANTGDVILLASGGHGFQMIEQSEIIEVKQGPYVESLDKNKF